MENKIVEKEFRESIVEEIKRFYEFRKSVAKIIVGRAWELSEKDGLEAVRATAMFLANFTEEIYYEMTH